MSFMDYTPALSGDDVSWYIYLEVFLRGNFDDVVTINTAVKKIETVRGEGEIFNRISVLSNVLGWWDDYLLPYWIIIFTNIL